MNRRLYVLALVAISACGRLGFERDATGDGGGSAGDDGGGSDGGNIIGPTDCLDVAPPDVSIPDVLVGNGTPVSCTQGVLQAALDQGGTIGFACGNSPYSISIGSELTISKTLTLAGSRMITLEGTGASRIMNVAAPGGVVTLVDMEISDGAAGDNGGGILVTNGRLVVHGTQFHGNSTGTGQNFGGGAIAQIPLNGSVELYDSYILNNRGSSGGGVMAYGNLTIVNSSLTGNMATGTGGAAGSGGLGGAINLAGPGSLQMCGTTVASNTANDLGGGIHSVCTTPPCNLEIYKSAFTTNTGLGGGGIYTQGYDVLVSQTTFVGNTAVGNVGGLWQIGSGSTQFENVLFTTNHAGTGNGGAVSLAGPGTIGYSTFVGNQTSDTLGSGGAITTTSTVMLRGSIFSNNQSGNAQSCTTAMTGGSGTLQFPVELGAPCGPLVQMQDPQLAAGNLRTGPSGTFFVHSPAAGSPALGASTESCPAVDLLGNTRAMPCTAGAIESPE